MKSSSFVFTLAAAGVLGAVFAACSGSTETTTGASATSVGVSASSASASSSGGAASASSSSSSGGKGGSGAGGAGGAGGQGGAGGAVCNALGDACTDCVFAACNDLYCPCEANSECAALAECILPCSQDDNCTEACYEAHPTAIAQALLVASCGDMNCKAECPASITLDPCEICTAQQCGTELDACYGSAACAAIIQCVRNSCASGDTTCDQNCAVAHLSGAGQADGLRMCAESKCAMDCANF